MASALAKADEYYTAEDYLRNEHESDERHEYWQGEVFNMAGASRIPVGASRGSSWGFPA